MKRVLFYFKKKKWLSFFLLSVLLLTLGFKTITDKIYVYLDDGYDRQSAELVEMVNSVLGIPYCQQPQYRNDSPDIVRLSKEEWFTIPDPLVNTNRDLVTEGKTSMLWIPPELRDASGEEFIDYTHPVNSNDIGAVANPLNLVESMPSIEEARHAESLELSPILYHVRFSQPIYRQLCGYFLTCKSLNISVREDFLQKPELLQNIIKIAERPCDYIRTIDEIKPGDEIVYSTYHTYMGGIFRPLKYGKESIELGVKWARERLDCDNKNSFTFPSIYHPSINNRKFVLLVINKKGKIGFNPEKSLNIIIERKDID
jgi:hypothetical protein